MSIDCINLFLIYFLLIFFSIAINNNTALHMLLTAEILWISLYGIVFLIGFFYDNLNLLSLTFFFLVLSAIEFGLGLVLLLCQNILTRTIFLTNDDSNFSKFFNRFKTKLYSNKIIWKN